MRRMSTLLSRTALIAAVGAGALGILAPAAQAHDRWHRDDRVVERCNRWGDHCRLYRCDWDGDCYRMSGPYGGPHYRGYYEREYYAPPPPPPAGFSLGVRVR